MAGKKEKAVQAARERKRRRGLSRWLPAFLIVLLVGGCFGWMHFQARLTHLKQAQVYLEDLPEEMDGTTLLYLSDLNIRSASDRRAGMRLMQQLSRLEPDLLVLGGDYSAPDLLDELNGSEGNAQGVAAEFIRGLSDFPAKLGKYAVTGENDAANVELEEAFAEAGIEYLEDRCAVVEKNGSELVLAGLSDAQQGKTPYTEIGRYFSGKECVIAIAHSPASYVDIRVNEARGGGAWADLVLSGHTLGGQLKLFGRTLRSYPDEVARCIGGWYYVDDLPMLVSEGVGCEGAMLRLGTQSEVWLLTLRCTQDFELPDLR